DDVRGAVGKPASALAKPLTMPAGPAKPLARVGLEPPPLPSFEQWGRVERQPLSHLRRTIADRMALSAALIPHVTHFDKADITDLGALGGTGAIPIINYPEVAILGVARGREEAVVRGGQIVPRLLLPISLTFDHRVADGADGARFAQAIIRRLEAPETLFVEW